LDHGFFTDVIPGDRFYYNRLFHDYIFEYSRLKGFFRYDHESLGSFKERIQEIGKTYDEGYRAASVPILEQMNRRLGAGEKTMQNISRLGKAGSVAVIGGQQPGLFTGPIFIIYKIITILKLSRFIQENTGAEVIPCFWNASDDSSLDQADRLGIAGDPYDEIMLDTSGISQDTRLSHVRLDSSCYEDVIKKMELIMTGTGTGKEWIRFLKGSLDFLAAGKDDNSIGLTDLFSHIILRLFSEWGPVIIDPSDAGLKKLGRSFLEWDMKNHAGVKRSIREKGKSLIDAGYHAQLEPGKDVLDFFINRDGVRSRVSIDPGGKYGSGGEKYSAEGLLEMADRDPSSISWNVVLRPLIQDTIFPVAATVCGPGEIGYFAQLEGVYRLRGIGMPIIYPRLSATILEKKICGYMEKTGIDKDLLALDRQDALEKALKGSQGEDLERIIGGLERDIYSSIENARDNLEKNGLDTLSSFDRIRRNLGKEIKVLSQKLLSALKKQNQLLVKSIDRIYAELFPDGMLQERKANIFYYAGKYGMDIINKLYDSYRPFKKGHILIYPEVRDKHEK
jgi:bacillithiol synthase